MSAIVLDASVALAWVLPEKGTADRTRPIMDRIVIEGGVAPGLWKLEIGNVLLLAERRGRIPAGTAHEALANLAELPVLIDRDAAAYAWTRSADLARAHSLTLYDATYLELALRRSLPLATLDNALRRAADMEHVTVAPE